MIPIFHIICTFSPDMIDFTVTGTDEISGIMITA